MLIASQLTIFEIHTQPKCPSTDTKKLCYIKMSEHYSVVKKYIMKIFYDNMYVEKIMFVAISQDTKINIFPPDLW